MTFPPVPAADKMPRPLGTPAIGNVPEVSQVSPLQLEWSSGGGGGPLVIADGGTGQATAAAAFAALSPLAAEGDLIYENATPAPANLAVGSAGQMLGVSGGLPAWVNPPADLSLLLAPAGATGETFPRDHGTGYTAALTSQQAYASAVGLPAGLTVSNITLLVGNTAAAATPVHGWYALLDSSRIVRAVSADQTSAWGTTFTAVTLPMATPYVTAYSGLFYLVVAIDSAEAMPVFVNTAGTDGGTIGYPPILCGTIGTATQTTPPATGGSALGTLTASPAFRFYAYTS